MDRDWKESTSTYRVSSIAGDRSKNGLCDALRLVYVGLKGGGVVFARHVDGVDGVCFKGVGL